MHLYQNITFPNRSQNITWLFGLFHSRSDSASRKYYILGIKVLRRKRLRTVHDQLNDIKKILVGIEDKQVKMTRQQYVANAVVALHSQVFPPFKNKHKGQAAVLLASGPTLNNYTPIKDAVHVGVNTLPDFKAVSLDYYFCIDFRAIQKLETLYQFMASKYVKFFGQHADYPQIPLGNLDKWHVPDSFVEKLENAHLFYFSQYDTSICKDVETMPLRCYNSSCVFTALDFILYAGFSKIYLVGCDCSFAGHFNGEKQEADPSNQFLRGWRIVRDHVRIFYPDVEVISINPVGLKGMFRDVYTDSSP